MLGSRQNNYRNLGGGGGIYILIETSWHTSLLTPCREQGDFSLKSSLKVLFIARGSSGFKSLGGSADAFSIVGGEQTQIMETRAQLVRMGVEVDVSDSSKATAQIVSKYDVIHCFGLGPEILSLLQVLAQFAGRKRPIIACSPIFYHRFQEFSIMPLVNGPGVGEHQQGFKGYWGKIRKYCGASGFIISHPIRAAKIVKTSHFNDIVSTSSLAGQFSLLQGLLNVVDIWLPNSLSEWNAVSEFYSLLGSKRFIVPNAVGPMVEPAVEDNNIANKLGEYILCSGGIDRRKNQYGLLYALGESAEVKVVFAGQIRDQKYGEAVKKLARARGNVVFMGSVGKSLLTALYRSALAHALPSFHETPGISNLEAIANASWNVSTSLGGLYEYVGPHSVYANPYNPASIKQAIYEAISKTGRNEMGREVASGYTWNKTALCTLRAYLSVL